MLGISHESSVVMAPKRTKTSSSPASSSVTAPCSAGERDLLIFNSVTGGQIVLKPGEQFSPINRAFVQGKFEPSLEMNNNGTITKVTFAWLAGVFLSGDMVLVTGPIPLSLRFVSGAKLTLMVEEMRPIIKTINPKLTSKYDFMFLQLFAQDVGQPVHLRSVSCSWDRAPSAIVYELEQSAKTFRHVYVGQVTRCGIPPNSSSFKLLDEFFAPENFTFSRKCMVLVVRPSSEVIVRVKTRKLSIGLVPDLPKKLLLKALHLLKESECPRMQSMLRKIIAIAYNGGICAEFLRDAEISLAFVKERVVIKWENLTAITDDFSLILDDAIWAARNHLPVAPTEAEYCSLVWNSCLNASFHHDTFIESTALDYRLSYEWVTSSCFPRHDERRIDAVALVPLSSGVECPVLVVESGLEVVPVGRLHKDSAKSCCILAASCEALARDLVKQKKRPEMARCFGMLVGGHTARFMVAHPIISTVDHKRRRLHIVITSDPSWTCQLLELVDADSNSADKEGEAPPPPPTVKPLAGFPDMSFFELIERVEDESSDVEQLPEVDSIFEEVDLDEADAEGIDGDDDIVDDDDDLNSSASLKWKLNFQEAKKMKFFIEGVKARVSLLESSKPAATGPDFLPPNPDGIFPEGMDSSLHSTPSSKRIAEFDPVSYSAAADTSSVPGSPTPTRGLPPPGFDIVLHAMIQKPLHLGEYDLVRKLSALHPHLFPRLLQSDLDVVPGHAIYTVERLSSLVQDNGALSLRFKWGDGAGVLLEVVKLLLDCSVGLHILHESIGFVHSDVSVGNIMFSQLDGVWKLIDFDQSLPIADSLATSRTAGTPGFIAPESAASGLFSAASDIWSLGAVVFNVLFPLLDSLIHSNQNHPTPDFVKTAFWSVENLVVQMMAEDPDSRPRLLEVMRACLKVIKVLDYKNKLYPRHDPAIQAAVYLTTAKLERVEAVIETSIKTEIDTENISTASTTTNITETSDTKRRSNQLLSRSKHKPIKK